MATRKKDSGVVETLKGGASVLTDILFGSIFPKLQSETTDLLDKVEKRAILMQERLMQRLAVSVINGLGILFLLFALFYYMIEFQGMTRTHGFLLIGAALLLIAFIMKYQMLKNERR